MHHNNIRLFEHSQDKETDKLYDPLRNVLLKDNIEQNTDNLL
jgi:hypothetical protein